MLKLIKIHTNEKIKENSKTKNKILIKLENVSK